ncbi:MAG: type II CAAX endopeptidase family protein [Oscillospiraceae bacterium]
MAKKAGATTLTHGEKMAGTVFFVLYLLILPLITKPLLALLGRLLGVSISSGLGNTIYYYLLFAVTLVIFHHFIGRTTSLLIDGLGRAFRTLGAGAVAFYGLNELMYRVTRLLTDNHTNLNDMTISAQMDSAPRTTILIVIFLAPFVEEVLFRGLVFGGIRGRSRAGAYLISCALFAFLHVWQFALVNQDATYFLLMLQYLVPGLVFCWVFEHSGTLWTAIFLHAGINALSVLSMLGR